MRFLVLFTIVVIALCGQAAAQCFSASFRCLGATTADSSFEDCCRQVVANNNLERSFFSGGRCSSCIVLGLDRSQYTLAERSIFYSLRLRLIGPANTPFLRRPRLRLRGVPGTASEEDFRVVSSDILIQSAAGLDVAVTITDDGIAGEPRETFTITSQPPLVNGTNDAQFLFRDSVITIIDSDQPTYQFNQGDYVTTEGPNAHIEVVVQQIVQSVRDIHLLLTPLTYAQYIARSNQPGSPLAEIDIYHGSRPSNAHHEMNRQDFNNSVRRVFFPADSGVGAERRVDFPVFDDVVDEDPEGFIIVLDVDRNLTNVNVFFTPNLRTTLGRINDDDPFFFGFEQEEFVYNEIRDQGPQEIVYSPAPGNKTEKTFTFALNLNALQGAFTFGTNEDISFGSNIIRPTFQFFGTLLPPSPPVRTITFDVNRDYILEGQEIGLLTIAPSTSFDGFVPRFQTVRIIINDSNSATVTLSAPPTVPEQNRSFFATISLTEPSGGTTIPLEIDIDDIGITATRFSDYLRFAPPSVVFQGVDRPGCCVRTVLYDITDDNIAEPDEILTLSIVRSLASNQIPVEYVVQSVNVTIVDNDAAIIGFVNTDVVVSEASGIANLTIQSTPLSKEVTVRFSTADNTAVAGTDYTTQVITLSFNQGVRQHTVSVPILQDTIKEEKEQFQANLELVNNNGLSVVVRPAVANVTIIDSNIVVVKFVQNSYVFNESDGTGLVDIEMVGQVDGTNVTVTVIDNEQAIRQVELPANVLNPRVSLMVNINDNDVALENDLLRVFRIINTSSPAIIGQPNITTVTIRDDDTVNVGYTRSSSRFSEADGSGTINVSISNRIATSFTVRAQGGPRSRPQPLVIISGTDVNQQLTFTPTSPMTMSISMTINDDEIGLEQNEVFPLAFSESDSRVIVGGRGLFSSTDITIEDDDELDISMVRPAITVREDAGFAEVCFMLSRQSTVFIDVSIDGQSGSAIENNDFREVQSQVGVVPPSRRGCVNYTIIQDSVVEQDETFTVRLTSAANPGIRQPRFPEPRSTVVTIVDPTPTDSTCVVTPDGRIQAFQKDGEGTVYRFRRPCEHPLLTTCSRRVPSDFGIFIDTTSGTTSTAVIGVRINGTTVIVNEEYALPSLGVSVRFDRLNGSVTITISTDSPLQDECGLCGRRNGSLVLPNGNQINASRGSDVEEFITSYRVMPGDTFLMPDRRQCGILTNDTVEGDPTFTVPLLTFRNEDHTLCYEIHGEANRFLNLVSDICVSVNAHYVERPNPRPGSRRPLNIIDQIAVRATDSMGKCINIVVNLVNGECQAMVGTQNLSNNGTMFVENRLSVRSYRTMARISVPNCENVRLVMRVYCELTNGVHMIRYHINRGYNLRPTSHGLVAQFWNIPATVERYTGTLRDGSRRDDAYIITLRPPNSPIRRVPAFLSSLQWNLSPKSCLYAGNAQGGPIYEIVSPNDPLIEGRYQNYFSSSSFDTNFQYERFDETSCTA